MSANVTRESVDGETFLDEEWSDVTKASWISVNPFSLCGTFRNSERPKPNQGERSLIFFLLVYFVCLVSLSFGETKYVCIDAPERGLFVRNINRREGFSLSLSFFLSFSLKMKQGARPGVFEIVNDCRRRRARVRRLTVARPVIVRTRRNVKRFRAK